MESRPAERPAIPGSAEGARPLGRSDDGERSSTTAEDAARVDERSDSILSGVSLWRTSARPPTRFWPTSPGRQLVRRWQISLSKAYAPQGTLPTLRIGANVRFPLDAVIAYERAQPRPKSKTPRIDGSSIRTRRYTKCALLTFGVRRGLRARHSQLHFMECSSALPGSLFQAGYRDAWHRLFFSAEPFWVFVQAITVAVGLIIALGQLLAFRSTERLKNAIAQIENFYSASGGLPSPYGSALRLRAAEPRFDDMVSISNYLDECYDLYKRNAIDRDYILSRMQLLFDRAAMDYQRELPMFISLIEAPNQDAIANLRAEIARFRRRNKLHEGSAVSP